MDRLLTDLLLDRDSCCVRTIIEERPRLSLEHKNRLDLLKSVTLLHPPPYYLVARDTVPRVQFHRTQSHLIPTNAFIGAEFYYYLVERGENPTTILLHLGIVNRDDIVRVLEVTDRPSNEFECRECGEYMPHAKFLHYLYTSDIRDPRELLPRPDIPVRECCVDTILGLTLTDEEVEEAEKLADELQRRHPGVPTQLVAHSACTSCGSEEVSRYEDYEWLVHHGIPPTLALNYFALSRICCRQNMMNPIIRVRPSQAVVMRELQQASEIPPETVVNFDYEANRLPSLGEI